MVVVRDRRSPERAVGDRERRLRRGSRHGLRRRGVAAREQVACEPGRCEERHVRTDDRRDPRDRRTDGRVDRRAAGVQPRGAGSPQGGRRRGRTRARASLVGFRSRRGARSRADRRCDRTPAPCRARARGRGGRRRVRAPAELGLDRCEVVLGDDALEGSRSRRGTSASPRSSRARDAARSRRGVALEAVARELGSALQTAGLLVENARRLEQQQALLRASQVVTGELTARRCCGGSWNRSRRSSRRGRGLLPDRPRAGNAPLRRRHGFDSSLVGFEFVPEGLPEDALRGSAPLGPERSAHWPGRSRAPPTQGSPARSSPR